MTILLLFSPGVPIFYAIQEGALCMSWRPVSYDWEKVSEEPIRTMNLIGILAASFNPNLACQPFPTPPVGQHSGLSEVLPDP